MLASNGPPPSTKCQSTPSENANAAATAAMPTTAPLPGVRLPKNRMSAAEISGSSTTIQACSTNQMPSVVALKAASPSDASAVTT